MTTSLSPSVGSKAASAGRSMPGIVRSASLAIAISAPVLPPETQALASPSFTAAIARPIELVLARRIAWLGLSSPAMTSSQWTISETAASAGRPASSARIAASSPNSRKDRSSRRSKASAAPAIITAGPESPPIASIAIRGALPTVQPLPSL